MVLWRILYLVSGVSGTLSIPKNRFNCDWWKSFTPKVSCDLFSAWYLYFSVTNTPMPIRFTHLSARVPMSQTTFSIKSYPFSHAQSKICMFSIEHTVVNTRICSITNQSKSVRAWMSVAGNRTTSKGYWKTSKWKKKFISITCLYILCLWELRG